MLVFTPNRPFTAQQLISSKCDASYLCVLSGDETTEAGPLIAQ